jgi:hypothetical protein
MCEISGSHSVCMKIAVFWVVGPCSLVEVYRRFRGACCLHQGRIVVLCSNTNADLVIDAQYKSIANLNIFSSLL